ncbi:class I SAM-dependent methyltransferase [Neorhizobium petrolearium]|uniref:class I SAM-dependent methyltransferase n=1 Tax=Neorhizobium petrolearium TaxID=515361 RepID=UPI003F188438
MIFKGESAVRRIVNDVTWQKFRLSVLALKRVLDFKAPFDFAAAVKAGPVLLVGEGNLSFSTVLSALASVSASNITATTFQTKDQYSEETSRNARVLYRRGVRTMGGIDATSLSRWFGRRTFDLIVFQFPNVGSREPLYGRNPNHILVRRFLKSAAEHLTLRGRVAITVVNSSHYDGAFDMDGAAERNDYTIPVVYPFYFSDYPGYSHVKTKDDGISALDKGDEFVTYVFQRNRGAVRKWIMP